MRAMEMQSLFVNSETDPLPVVYEVPCEKCGRLLRPKTADAKNVTTDNPDITEWVRIRVTALCTACNHVTVYRNSWRVNEAAKEEYEAHMKAIAENKDLWITTT